MGCAVIYEAKNTQVVNKKEKVYKVEYPNIIKNIEELPNCSK